MVLTETRNQGACPDRARQRAEKAARKLLLIQLLDQEQFAWPDGFLARVRRRGRQQGLSL